MDLNKIFPLLPDSDQSAIKKIVLSYLGSLTKSMGYSMVEDVGESPTTVLSPPKPVSDRRPPNKIFPLKIHGLSIPNKQRLLELFNDVDGPWEKGKLSWTRIAYLRYNRRMEWDDIFPNPPKQDRRDTIIKRMDDNGEKHYPM
jgi:hypothetical protein